VRLSVLATLATLSLASAAFAEPLPGLPARVLQAPPDDIADDAPSRAKLLHLFMDGVLRSERGTPAPVARWAGPVTITLTGLVTPYAGFVTDLAAELAGLTGLPVSVVADGSPPAGNGIDVYLAANPRYWPAGVRSADPAVTVFTCAAAPGVRDGVIRRSTIRINAGLLDPDTVRACLLEEIVQSMGLLGELDGEGDTLLDDRVGFEHLGAVDRLLLRTLYDPRLTPGMARDAARPLAAAILEEGLAHLACEDKGDGRRCQLR
jgi:hypothetical protein